MTLASRRHFLRSAGAIACVSPWALAQDPVRSDAVTTPDEGGKPAGQPAGPPFEISLAQWSFHRTLRKEGDDGIANHDFPTLAHSLGFTAIEWVNAFIRDGLSRRGYVENLAARAEQLGVQSLLIMCDGEGQVGHPEKAGRAKTVDNHKKWLDAAKVLGCHSIRVNAQSSGSRDEQMHRAADGLRSLCEVADGYDLNVLVENHGGNSSDGSWLAATLAAVEHPRIGALPDFGNFTLSGDQVYDRYRGVAEMMPFAKAVSAKSNDFDVMGEEVHTDFDKMLRIVVGAGYRGFIGVEYEGAKLSEREGTLVTKALLEKKCAVLAAEEAGAPR